MPVSDETGRGGHYTVTRSFGPVSYSAICVPDRRAAERRALMSYSGNVALGVPARETMEILGHSRIAVTLEIYTAADNASRRDAVERLNQLFEPGSW